VTVVVADTSPLNYLVLIGQIEILQVLYGRAMHLRRFSQNWPTAVLRPKSRIGFARGPNGFRSGRLTRIRTTLALQQIDPGERAAILLAQEEPDVLLLIDDAAGRAEADRRDIPNTGTLGVLRAAALRQLVDLPAALNRLTATNFRVSQSLIDELIHEDAERKRPAER
jgi:predicted nucleic acid-binding protein